MTRGFPRTYTAGPHQDAHVTEGASTRPATTRTPYLTRPMSAGMSGPVFKGMDPSDPATYVRAWNPAPGMIARLNFDGAKYQGETPTGGNRRGPETTRRRAG